MAGVHVTRQGKDPGRREEEVGVHTVQNLVEGVEVPIGREIYVGLAVGHASHCKVCDERAPSGAGVAADEVQVMGSVE